MLIVRKKDSYNDLIFYIATSNKNSGNLWAELARMLNICFWDKMISVSNHNSATLTDDGHCGLVGKENTESTYIVYCKYDEVFNSTNHLNFVAQKFSKQILGDKTWSCLGR
ncbi:MAG: hypothetical protein HOL93_11705 [Candidatus Marinimicrobia bacterium]|nr:hypothetical protein [Candidatus Neomarinimicrobiota bacterium]